MRHQFEKCVDKGKIIRIEIDTELVEKELQESRYDVISAQRSIDDGNYKWAIVQTYYSMFHALKVYYLMKVTGRRAMYVSNMLLKHFLLIMT